MLPQDIHEPSDTSESQSQSHVHVPVISESLNVTIPSVAPNALQASVCDEQLRTISGEIALSGNNAIWTGTRRGKKCIMGVLQSV